jgi:pyrroline-5-carboxylate reductase
MDGFDSVGLVGGGQMGEALVRGMIGAGLLKADNVMIVEPDGDRRIYLSKTYSVKVTEDAAELVRFSSILILAVKPQIMGKVLEQYKKLITEQHLIISIAAGVTIKSMEMGLGENVKIVRVMPNTPAGGGKACSPDGLRFSQTGNGNRRSSRGPEGPGHLAGWHNHQRSPRAGRVWISRNSHVGH